MEPALRAGDFLAVRAPKPGEPREGQIVVVRDAERESVKRVIRIVDGNGVWVEGDNARSSTDSRLFGALPRSAVVGVVRARYWPVWRARRF